MGIYNFICTLYNDNNTYAQADGRLQFLFKVRAGVLQGCPLSGTVGGLFGGDRFVFRFLFFPFWAFVAASVGGVHRRRVKLMQLWWFSNGGQVEMMQLCWFSNGLVPEGWAGPAGPAGTPSWAPAAGPAGPPSRASRPSRATQAGKLGQPGHPAGPAGKPGQPGHPPHWPARPASPAGPGKPAQPS